MITGVEAVDPVTRPLPLLTGYDAKRCQRPVHNLQQRFDAGKAVEADVFAALGAAGDPVRRCDLLGLGSK